MVQKKTGILAKQILRDFFECPCDFRLDICWQAQTTEDARENMFHCLPAFFR